MVRRKGVTSVGMYLPDELAARLKRLSDTTRVSQAAYFREAVEDLLKKYEKPSKPGAKGPRGSE